MAVTNDTLTQELCAMFSLVLRAMVADKDRVRVIPIRQSDGRTVLQVSVGDKDRGKILGRGGRIARSLRIVLLGITRQQGGNYSLDILSGWEEVYARAWPSQNDQDRADPADGGSA